MKRSTEGFHWTPASGFHYGLPTAAVVPGTPKSALSPTYDVIVLGAGFTGLTTARDLAFRGKKVLLIEARDRIGGRCWTAQTGSDPSTNLEIGGAWVHWQQPHVFSELQRYGLDEFEETVFHPDAESVAKESRTSPAKLLDPSEGKAMMDGLGKLMDRFFNVDGHGGRSVVSFPFNTAASLARNPAYAEVDRLSIADRVKQLESEGCSAEEVEMLSAHAASFYGVEPEKASFLEVLHTHALCGFDQAMMETATMKFKIKRGTTALARAILDEYTGHRIFSAPVAAVIQYSNLGSQHGHGFPVAVKLKSGEVYQARSVVSTVPVNVIDSIAFEPPLSERRKGAFTSGVTSARTDKLLVCTSSQFEHGLNVSCEGEAEGDELPFTSGFTDGTHGDHTLLTILTRPDHDLDRSDGNIRLLEALHPAGLEVHSVYGHIWSNDPYARGVMPVRGPGFLNRYHEEVRKRHALVFFAGSDFAEGWRGFVSGAFEDAYRVTREVLAGEFWDSE